MVYFLTAFYVLALGVGGLLLVIPTGTVMLESMLMFYLGGYSSRLFYVAFRFLGNGSMMMF
jgi:hypothetical protein